MPKIVELTDYKTPALTVDFFMEKYNISRGKALSFMKNTPELCAYFIGKTLYVEKEDYQRFLNLARETGGTQMPFVF